MAITATFSLRTVASIVRTLNIHYRQVSAKVLENVSLGIIALGLLGFGISLFVFPTLYTPLGISVLFLKIVSLTIGALTLLSTAANIMFRSRADIYDSKIEIKDVDKNKRCNERCNPKYRADIVKLLVEKQIKEKGEEELD